MLLRSAARVICVNEKTAEAIARLGVITDVVAPHSVTFSVTSLPAEMEAFVNEHSPVLACVGLYSDVYGFDEAIDAVGGLRDTHPRLGLLLIGEPSGSEPYRTRIKSLSLDEHVKMCGNLSHDECTTAIRRSSVFLRLTRFDGDSLSVREALALGVPVVATRTDFRPAGVTLYEKGSIGDFADKIRLVLGTGRATRRPQPDTSNLEAVRRIYLEALEKGKAADLRNQRVD
jgi:glycosyltransferase involved in cell wall biosynthesis